MVAVDDNNGGGVYDTSSASFLFLLEQQPYILVNDLFLMPCDCLWAPDQSTSSLFLLGIHLTISHNISPFWPQKLAQGKSYDTSCANQNLYTELNIGTKGKPLSFPLNYDLLKKYIWSHSCWWPGLCHTEKTLKKFSSRRLKQCCCPFVSIMHVLSVHFI